MYASLKFLHFLSLWIAGGIGIGGWVLQVVHQRGAVRPSPQVVQSLRVLGGIALVALAVLWTTGLWMVFGFYGSLPPIPALYVKLLAAVILFGASLGMNLETLLSMRTGSPPRARLMTVLAWTVRVALVVVLVAAVTAFT